MRAKIGKRIFVAFLINVNLSLQNPRFGFRLKSGITVIIHKDTASSHSMDRKWYENIMSCETNSVLLKSRDKFTCNYAIYAIEFGLNWKMLHSIPQKYMKLYENASFAAKKHYCCKEDYDPTLHKNVSFCFRNASFCIKNT